jgi:hypothetical protein
MPENKTRPTVDSPSAFLDQIQEPALRDDCLALSRLMEEVSGQPPVMWGSSIIGFGNHHYKYESGRQGDMPVIAFSPRKQAITIYLKGYLEQYKHDLDNLGKFKTGKGCLYIKAMKDIDPAVLRKLLADSVASTAV